jgi:hypothetical protein
MLFGNLYSDKIVREQAIKADIQAVTEFSGELGYCVK